MTSELLTLNLSDLETLIAKSNCSCHFINPNKTRIILWKEVKKNEAIYYLRIGIQKFVSYPLKDKNQALYWKFNCFETQPEKATETIPNPDPNDQVTKFQQRLAKTQAINHGKSNSTTDSSEPAESTSH